MHTLLRPRWIAGHLLALVMVVGFVRLGIWQLDRHEEKSGLRAAVAVDQAKPVIPIEDVADGTFRRVTASGTYDAALTALVLRSSEGVSGYHVLTPLVLSGGDAVLVDRGWIPLDAAPPTPPSGLVMIDGALWPAEKGSSIPSQQPDVVRRIDPEIQAAFASYPMRSDYLILGSGPGGTAVLAEAPGIGLGPHLGYAGQWFLFAVIVTIGYPLLLRRSSRREPTSGR